MRRAILVLLVLLAPLVSAACAINPPRIVAISPARDATEVATNQQIQIGFDRAMNHASVESRFELQPKLAGCDTTPRDCGFAWTNNTLVYQHGHVNLELSTRYTVRLKGGYADASGQSNTLDHSWHFSTEGRPSLAAVDPPDNATSVGPDRNIILTFSRPMRPDSMQAGIQLTPDTSFLIRTRPGGDTSQFEIIPQALLLPNQSYTVSVDRPVDVHGNAIFGRVQSRFKTGPYALPRKIGYLIGQRDQPAFGVAVVDPHLDPFLNRSTPKLAWKLTDQAVVTDAILSFDWAPDGRRLVVVDAVRGAREGQLRIEDLSTGQDLRLGIHASDVVWSPDGSIIYLANGVVRRYRPATLEDTALTDPADGRVIAPLTFSPDGKSIAYAATDVQGANHVWILNVDLRTRFRPPGLDDPADHPAWSLDGTRLAFRRLAAGGTALWIYDLSASGTNAYRRAAGLDLTGAAWLNDNSTLFGATGTGTNGALYRVNIFSAGEAGGVVKVTGTKDNPNGSMPATPGYDRRLAYVGVIDELPQIFVMNGDGSRPQQLTEWEADFPYTGLAPNWTTSG
ncbi:MAG: Ig-like domain-containing protein [Candidatus Dormibacteraeota bacterium]|nr:Ig-like domain-containing protein [Candidatus Dormibacteraeota bacterium]